MTNNNISIQERTENFSVRVIKAYCQLNKRNFADAHDCNIKTMFKKWHNLSNKY